jgi:hypothetical protein
LATPQSKQGTNRDKQGKSFVESVRRGPNFSAQEVFIGNYTPYEKVLSQLKQLELCNIDIKTLPLLVNNRGFVVVLNNGSLIYTE